MGDLRDFVRSHLGNPELPFYLCESLLSLPLFHPGLPYPDPGFEERLRAALMSVKLDLRAGQSWRWEAVSCPLHF